MLICDKVGKTLQYNVQITASTLNHKHNVKRVKTKTNYLNIWVQDFPKATSSKPRETVWMAGVKWIVRREGACRPSRYSGGTQYNSPPSESLTQPSESG